MLSALLLVWLCFGCGEEGPVQFEDCLYSEPEPIFGEHIQGVSKHAFERDRLGATERFQLAQGTAVTIEQRGCDYIHQSFTFVWDDGPAGQSSVFWARQAARCFEELAQLGAPFLTFQAISDAIRARERELIAGGQPITLQPGLMFRLEASRSGQQLRLTAELFEEAPL